MKQFILILLLLIATVCSCRTPGQMEQRIDSSFRKESTGQSVEDISLQENIEKALRESVEELKRKISDTTFEYNRVNYSPPDSTGKQYPTMEETGKLHHTTQEENSRKEQTDEQYRMLASYAMQLSSKMDTIETRMNQLDTTYKDSLSWYQSALIFAGIFFVVYILVTIYLKLKAP